VLVIDMQNDFGEKGGMFDLAGVDISIIRNVVGPTARVLTAARKAGFTIIYLKMAFRPDLTDAGVPDMQFWVKHGPFAVGTVVRAPDGTKSRIFIRDTWSTEILDELTPQEGDVVLYKTRFSGFYDTELDTILRERGIKYLIITGCTTSVCVDSTIRDASFRDYSCVLLEDCTAEPIGHDLQRSSHEASLLIIETVFGWVSGSLEFLNALGDVPPADGKS
jgi:ureidoacrylate peracid hydrolase